MKNEKLYELETSPLFRLRNRRKLAELLGLSSNYFRKPHEYQFRIFSQSKRSGGKRLISDPEPALKSIQRRLCNLLIRINTPDWLKAGKKHCSYVDNAAYHEDAKYVRTMDISAFYDSVQHKYVYDMFRNIFMMEKDIAGLITNLVLDSNGKLPTGSPTSQIVAYWSYKELFARIYSVAEKYGCTFSLYVDDMTFSSPNPISDKMRYEVACLLRSYGLDAKHSKDHYYKKDDAKVITGVCIKDGKMYVLNRNRKKIIDQYKLCKANHNAKNIRKLQGMLNSARQIEPDIFPSMSLKLLA